MPKGYIKSQTSVHFMHYHFVWCPKYRRPVLVGKIERVFKKLIELKCKEIDCKIKALEIMPEHTHLFIQANPTQSPNFIISQIKGYTSRMLRKNFKELRKMPTLWTRSYFVSTHGHVSNAMIKKYIEEQKGR
jgi:putative transposase